jgi:acetylglutamate kinase
VTPIHHTSTRPLVLKIGGELLEDPGRLRSVVDAVAALVRAGTQSPAGVTRDRSGASASGVGVGPHACPLVIIHGGGKEIDAALRIAGIEKRQVDGLRVTDTATLDVVVPVLAGAVNTRLVAALGAEGVDAVGLTGADGRCGLAHVMPPHRAVDGREVDLGRVGVPSADGDVRVFRTLLDEGFVPVVACIGVTAAGELLNVNADTLAGHLAARLRASRLVIAGTTAGVLDARGATLAALEPGAIAALVSGGTATAGMIAKLRACEDAIAGGVDEVVIVDGRDAAAIVAAATGAPSASATRIAGLKSCATTA